MAAFQTGVPLGSAVPLVGMVPRYDIATAPILLQSTMVQTAWDLETKQDHVTQIPAQVKAYFFFIKSSNKMDSQHPSPNHGLWEAKRVST